MDAIPSSLKEGDFVLYHHWKEKSYGIVSQVFENGAFIKPTDEHGIRLLKKTQWCPDDATFIEEINGESMFQV